MDPTFFTLFKRGKYYHRSSEESSGSAKREERERFTVAAIAFCLKHDEAFLQHFFETICRFEGDPALQTGVVDVEPHQWSDLVVYNKTAEGTVAYVIECKAGADLAEHQNPCHASFEEGYERQMLSGMLSLPAAQVRYVILGHGDKLASVARKVKWQQRSWADVSAYKPSGITESLFNSLGQLGIREFSHRLTNNMSITADLFLAAQAGQLLSHAAEQIGLRTGFWQLNVSASSNEQWWFGVDVSVLPTSYVNPPHHRALSDLLQGNGESLCWFGYVPHPAGGRLLSVWFYCAEAAISTAVRESLRESYPEVVTEEDAESGSVSVIVSTVEHQEACDRDWFVSIFQKLAALPDFTAAINRFNDTDGFGPESFSHPTSV